MPITGLHHPDFLLAQRLAEGNVATIEGDAKFFRRQQHRSHRLRVASPAEIETALLVERRPPAPLGCAWYTTVKQVSPGFRLRGIILRAEGLDCDVPEDLAREIFERAVGSKRAGN